MPAKDSKGKFWTSARSFCWKRPPHTQKVRAIANFSRLVGSLCVITPSKRSTFKARRLKKSRFAHTTNTEPTSKSAYHGFFSFGTAHRRAVRLTTFIAVCWFLLCQAAGPKSVRRRCFFPPTAACPRNRPINSLSGCVFAQRAPLRPKDVHFRVSTAPLYVYLRE